VRAFIPFIAASSIEASTRGLPISTVVDKEGAVLPVHELCLVAELDGLAEAPLLDGPGVCVVQRDDAL
jgi:hypothetical protein